MTASMAGNPKPSPRNMIKNGCKANDIAEVSRGIQAAVSKEGRSQELLSWSLSRAVSSGHPEAVRYLLEQEEAPLDSLSPSKVGLSKSAKVFQVLADNGWDINQTEPDRGAGPGQTLLQLVCDDESLVRWCLDHGASVQVPHSDPYRSPPLLEIVASIGTVSTFALLHSHGAQMGPRTLHRAVGSTASSSRESGDWPARMAMVKYLVDDLKLNVNALDTKGQMPNYWGTPLCYAAHAYCDNEEVVHFLLDRGAEPRIKDCWGIHDAFSLAEAGGNFRLSNLLLDWVKEKRH